MSEPPAIDPEKLLAELEVRLKSVRAEAARNKIRYRAVSVTLVILILATFASIWALSVFANSNGGLP